MRCATGAIVDGPPATLHHWVQMGGEHGLIGSAAAIYILVSGNVVFA